MSREKLVRLYERSKELMEQSRTDMERYAQEIEEIDKNDIWKTAQKYRISPEELIKLIKRRDKENAELLARAGIKEERTKEDKNDEN